VLVLGVLAVLVAMVAPRFAEATARYQADAAARRVAADLTLARSEARLASSSRTVTFHQLGYRMPGVANPDRGSVDYVVNLGAAPYRVQALAADLGGDASVTFDAFGSADSGGSVTVRVGRWTRVVTIEPQNARVRVQ
jgi:hypothetical protein